MWLPRHPSRGSATKRKRARVSRHVWNLSNVNIRSVIAEVSRETGRNFLIDPEFKERFQLFQLNRYL